MKRCKCCSKEFEPVKNVKYSQQFCSRKCDSKWRYEHPKHNPCVCKHCGKTYIPKAADRNTYCSRECSFEDKRAKSKQKVRPVCVICGKEFEGLQNAKYCSDDCRRGKARRDAYEQAKAKHESTVKKRKCKECGTIFMPEYGSKLRNFCSDECSNKYGRKDYKIKRKRQMRKAFVSSVSFKKIYQRDQGICKICGQPVAYNKTPEDPMGATIDHIIPLSKGGKHHPDNCQLAHRLCNSLKGDKVIADYKAMEAGHR